MKAKRWESKQLEREILALPEEQAVNPGALERTLNRVKGAEDAIAKATETLAIIVKEERENWQLD